MTFAETILRIEDERMAEARKAIAAGWTPEDHPHKCCPHLVKQPIAPRKEAGDEWYETRARKAQERAQRLAAKLARMAERTERRPDFGEVNIPWSRRRERSAEAAVAQGVEYVRTVSELEHARASAEKWALKLKERKNAA